MLDLDYSSSSDEDDRSTGADSREQKRGQKRKSVGDLEHEDGSTKVLVRKKSVLPSFASISSVQCEYFVIYQLDAEEEKGYPSPFSPLSEQMKKDESALYQGRTLARPKVQGDYPTHIYLSFNIPPFLRALLTEAQADLPELYSLLDPSPSDQQPTSQTEQESSKNEKGKEIKLHVSLSRPLYLRADRKSAVEASLKDVVRRIKPFPLSFSTLSVFDNDDRTRTFLSIDVGAGFPELEALTDALNKALDRHHLPPYYTSPRFHTSIAWALLTPNSSSNCLTESTPKPDTQNGKPDNVNQKSFPSVEKIPPDLVKRLEKKFGDRIRNEGPWLVDEVQMKVGSEVSVFPLIG